jgi:hypothetical protein
VNTLDATLARGDDQSKCEFFAKGEGYQLTVAVIIDAWIALGT